MKLNGMKYASGMDWWLSEDKLIHKEMSFEERIFNKLMYSMAEFVRLEDTSSTLINRARHFLRPTSQFNNDVIFFELAAFLLYCIDRWHRENGLDELRSELVPYLSHKLDRLFDKFFHTQFTSEVFANRLGLYRQTNPEEDEDRTCLGRILSSARRHSLPHQFNNMPNLRESPETQERIDFYLDRTLPGLFAEIEGIYHKLGFLDKA